MNKLKFITLLCLLMQSMQGCSSTPKQTETSMNAPDSIILSPQQEHVFDNAATQPIDPNNIIQDDSSEPPQPSISHVKPTRSYWF